MKDGEAIAIIELSKSLVSNGCEVHLLAMNTTRHHASIQWPIPEPLKHYTSIQTVEVDNRINTWDAFTNLFSSDSYHISRFVSIEFENKLVEILQSQEFDVIQLETLYLAPYLNKIRKYSNALVAMRAHNIEHEIWERITAQIQFLPKKIYLDYLSRKLKKFEIGRLNDYDFLVAITDRDLNKFKSLGYKNGCISIPVGFTANDYYTNRESFQHKPSLSFIGSLDWLPNAEGLQWFLKEAWPLIHKEYPDLQFYFAGRKAPEELTDIKLKGVHYAGEVSHAKEFINQHSIMVVPLFAGSGIRIKILEAMALGRVVITSTIGMEGIPAIDKEHVLVANNPQEFLEAIGFCIKNPRKMLEISQKAADFTKEQFDSHQIAGKVIDAYQDAIQQHNP